MDLPEVPGITDLRDDGVRDSPDYKIIPYEKGIREHVVPEGTRRRYPDGRVTAIERGPHGYEITVESIRPGGHQD